MNSVATSSGGRIGDAEEQPTRAPPAASFTSLPLELTIKILALLDPLDVLAARQVSAAFALVPLLCLEAEVALSCDIGRIILRRANISFPVILSFPITTSTPQTSRALAHATRSLSLWRSIAHSLSERLPLSALPSRPSRSRQRSFLAESSVISTETAENELAEDLERHALSARQLEKRWDTEGAEPRAVFRTRAHIDRVTCLKLVVGRSRIVNSDTSDRDCQNNGRGKAAEGVHVSALGGRGGEGSNLPCSRRGGAQLQTRRWLVTGAVDGFIRVWDLSGSLPDMRDHEYDRRRAGGDTELYNEEAADLRASGGSAEAGAGAGAAGGESSSAPAGSSRSSDFRRRTKGLLLAEIDTKADVTAIDAELGDNGETMRIAVGSYYVSVRCFPVPLSPHSATLRTVLMLF